MDDIFEMHLKGDSGEEILEGIASDFPYTNSRAFLDKYDVFWHWHRAVELFFVESGGLEYETPGGRSSFPAGSGGLINTGVLHMSRPQKGAGHTVQLLHIFDASLLSGQPDGRIAEHYFSPILCAPQIEVIPLCPGNPAHSDILERLRASFALSEREFGYEIKLREALSGIWLDLLGLLPPGLERGVRAGEKVKQMMAYVHKHYQEQIKVSDLAAAGFVSQRECYRSFQRFLHTTPVDYVKQYRLQIACRMLADGSDSITQISHACGFGSSSFFGKVFLASLGMTPTAYRRKWQDRAK